MKDQISQTKLEGKKVFRTIGFALFTMLIVIIIVQSSLMVFLNHFFPGFEQSPWYIGLLLGIPFYCVGFPIFLWIMKRIPNGPKGQIKKMTLKNISVIFIISMGGAYIFNIVGNSINMLISSIKGSDIINPLEAVLGTSNILSTIIFVGILSPVIEEIVFRGIILDKLRGYGQRTAIWFTAITFALFHGNLSQFFYALVLGIIFAYVAIRTNTIRYSIILHILVNIFGSVIMPILALSGNEVLVMLTGLVVIIFIGGGLALFKVNFKNIKLEDKGKQDNIKVSKGLAYGNIGMLFYYLACLWLFISTIML